MHDNAVSGNFSDIYLSCCLIVNKYLKVPCTRFTKDQKCYGREDVLSDLKYSTMKVSNLCCYNFLP